jgi:hypothetical protein
MDDISAQPKPTHLPRQIIRQPLQRLTIFTTSPDFPAVTRARSEIPCTFRLIFSCHRRLLFRRRHQADQALLDVLETTDKRTHPMPAAEA